MGSAKIVGVCLVTLALPYIWLVAASLVYCAGAGRIDLFVPPFTQWIQVAPYWQFNPWVTTMVVVSAAAPIALPIGLFIAIRRRRQPTP